MNSGQRNRIKHLVFGLFLATICHSIVLAQSQFAEAEIEFAEKWLPQALNSESIDDVMVGALIAESHDFSLNSYLFYARALELGLSRNDLLHGLVAHCSEARLTHNCDGLAIIAEFRALNPDNALTAAYAAFYHMENGDGAKALAELTAALNIKSFDDRQISRSFSVRIKLREIGYPQNRLIFMSTLYSMDNMPAGLYQALINICNEQGLESQDWRGAGIGFGKLMEDFGNTFIAVRVGQVIQSYMYGFSESDALVMQSVDRRRAYTHRWRELAAERLDFVRTPIDAPEIFYDDWLNHNEMYAMNQALGRLDGKRVRYVMKSFSIQI